MWVMVIKQRLEILLVYFNNWEPAGVGYITVSNLSIVNYPPRFWSADNGSSLLEISLGRCLFTYVAVRDNNIAKGMSVII